MKTKTPKWYLQKRRKRSYKKGIYLIYNTRFTWPTLWGKIKVCLRIFFNKPTTVIAEVKPESITFFGRFKEKK